MSGYTVHPYLTDQFSTTVHISNVLNTDFGDSIAQLQISDEFPELSVSKLVDVSVIFSQENGNDITQRLAQCTSANLTNSPKVAMYTINSQKDSDQRVSDITVSKLQHHLDICYQYVSNDNKITIDKVSESLSFLLQSRGEVRNKSKELNNIINTMIFRCMDKKTS